MKQKLRKMMLKATLWRWLRFLGEINPLRKSRRENQNLKNMNKSLKESQGWRKQLKKMTQDGNRNNKEDTNRGSSWSEKYRLWSEGLCSEISADTLEGQPIRNNAFCWRQAQIQGLLNNSCSCCGDSFQNLSSELINYWAQFLPCTGILGDFSSHCGTLVWK